MTEIKGHMARILKAVELELTRGGELIGEYYWAVRSKIRWCEATDLFEPEFDAAISELVREGKIVAEDRGDGRAIRLL